MLVFHQPWQSMEVNRLSICGISFSHVWTLKFFSDTPSSRSRLPNRILGHPVSMKLPLLGCRNPLVSLSSYGVAITDDSILSAGTGGVTLLSHNGEILKTVRLDRVIVVTSVCVHDNGIYVLCKMSTRSNEREVRIFSPAGGTNPLGAELHRFNVEPCKYVTQLAVIPGEVIISNLRKLSVYYVSGKLKSHIPDVGSRSFCVIRRDSVRTVARYDVLVTESMRGVIRRIDMAGKTLWRYRLRGASGVTCHGGEVYVTSGVSANKRLTILTTQGRYTTAYLLVIRRLEMSLQIINRRIMLSSPKYPRTHLLMLCGSPQTKPSHCFDPVT